MRVLGFLIAVLAFPLQALPTSRTPALPLRFEANSDGFTAYGSGYRVLLTNRGSLLQLTSGDRAATITTTLRHARPTVPLEGLEPQSAAIG